MVLSVWTQWLTYEWLMLQVHGCAPLMHKGNTSKDCDRVDNKSNDDDDDDDDSNDNSDDTPQIFTLKRKPVWNPTFQKPSAICIYGTINLMNWELVE